MVFDITGKIAIITGGAGGLGLTDAKELLRNGLRGVTLADVDAGRGRQAVKEIDAEFGPNKAIYLPLDVTNYNQFENVFKETIKFFKNVDILINNAGILDEKSWEKSIAINFNGVVNGTLLAMETYIQRHKSDREGVIVNLSSVAGVKGYAITPVYCATKHAVLGLGTSFGARVHYDRTKVRVVTVCPGVTDTQLMKNMNDKVLGEAYKKIINETVGMLPMQKPISVARAIVKLIKEAGPGTVWVAEADKPPYEFTMPDRETFAPI